mmetsp:Transcript_7739/g.12988  ORF Transcript_7739/g.12988 Transcript_7739/m.12988 type:complete len:138 (+) Transcript_7739:2876-3289(+)
MVRLENIRDKFDAYGAGNTSKSLDIQVSLSDFAKKMYLNANNGSLAGEAMPTFKITEMSITNNQPMEEVIRKRQMYNWVGEDDSQKDWSKVTRDVQTVNTGLISGDHNVTVKLAPQDILTYLISYENSTALKESYFV